MSTSSSVQADAHAPRQVLSPAEVAAKEGLAAPPVHSLLQWLKGQPATFRFGARLSDQVCQPSIEAVQLQDVIWSQSVEMLGGSDFHILSCHLGLPTSVGQGTDNECNPLQG